MMTPREPIYLFLPDLAQAHRVAAHCGLDRDEWAYVGSPPERYMRTPKPRTIYFLGEFTRRADYLDAMRIADKLGWITKVREIPPRKE